MPYIGTSPSQGVRRVHTYTATANQTTFTGAGAEGATLSYKDSNFVDVYQNGVKLGDADYTATSGTAIVLGTGATVSDLVVIVAYDVFSAADTVSKADGGTFDGAVTFAGGISGETTLATHLNLGDNDKIKLGASGDLEIYHDASNSYVDDTGTGRLFLRGNDRVQIQKYTGEDMVTAIADGAVKLYHNNANKLETTATGVNVTGAISASSGDVTITDGNLVVASGHGIDFSAASNNSGMTSELLDDYEEGTYTIAELSGQATITNNRVHYTRVGRLVTVQASITAGSNSNSNPLNLNLPFASSINGYYLGGGNISYTTANNDYVKLNMRPNIENAANNVFFIYNGSTALTCANLSGVRIDFAISYYT